MSTLDNDDPTEHDCPDDVCPKFNLKYEGGEGSDDNTDCLNPTTKVSSGRTDVIFHPKY